MKISVIVPNWNGIKFIGMCLDSLARSDFDSYEVIVVDNGSVDGSREMIEGKYPDVRLIKNRENMGFAIACNQGIKEPISAFLIMISR